MTYLSTKITYPTNPTKPCPECDHNSPRHKGEIEYETFVDYIGYFEPVAKWVRCENCNGTGEVDKDDEDAAIVQYGHLL